MKQLLRFFLAGALVLALAACGGGTTPSGAEENASAGTEDSISVGANATIDPADDPAPEDKDPAAQDLPAGENTPAQEDGGNAAEENRPTPEDDRTPSEEDRIPEEPVSFGGTHTPAEESTPPAAENSEPVAGTETTAPAEENPQPEESEEEDVMDQNTFYVSVGGVTFTASFADNSGAQALKELLAAGPVTISMSDYGGFEKVGSLGQSLPTSNSQTTTQAGDIVLYQGNQIVIFYGSNSWSYTRLGKVDDLTGWEDALGSGDVSVTFSLTD